MISASSSKAYGDMDLLTVVMHELCHVLGYEHTDGNGLMDTTLEAGERFALADGSVKQGMSAYHDRWRSLVRVEKHTLKFYPFNLEALGVSTDDDDDDDWSLIWNFAD